MLLFQIPFILCSSDEKASEAVPKGKSRIRFHIDIEGNLHELLDSGIFEPAEKVHTKIRNWGSDAPQSDFFLIFDWSWRIREQFSYFTLHHFNGIIISTGSDWLQLFELKFHPKVC